MDKKVINKIYQQIDKIAIKGITNHLEYFKYVDDCILNGNYDNLLQALYIYYHIDISVIKLSSELKQYWKIIVSMTLDPFTKRLKKLYTNKKVYQQSFTIYNDDDSTELGTIAEVEKYTPESKYYLKNKEYAKITKTIIIDLHVTRKSDNVKLILDTYNPNSSNDTNLYNKYAQGISFLLQQ